MKRNKVVEQPTWVRKGPGSYVSACRRFRILRDDRRPGRWVLFDSSRKDPCQPQYGWTEFCFSLGNAKRTAERLARQPAPAEASPPNPTEAKP